MDKYEVRQALGTILKAEGQTKNSYDKALKCCGCSSENLHMEGLFAHRDPSDDYSIADAVYIDSAIKPEELLIGPRFPGSGRSRELSLAIIFSCENCTSKSVKQFVFHKGSVFEQDAIVKEETHYT